MNSISDSAAATIRSEWLDVDGGSAQLRRLLQGPSPSLGSDPPAFPPPTPLIAEADERNNELLRALDGGVVLRSRPTANPTGTKSQSSGSSSNFDAGAARKISNFFGGGTGAATPVIMAETTHDLQIAGAPARAANRFAVDAPGLIEDRAEPFSVGADLPTRLHELRQLRDGLVAGIADLAAKRAIEAPASAVTAASAGVSAAARATIVAEIERALDGVNRLLCDLAGDSRPEADALRIMRRDLTGMAIAVEFNVDADAAADALVAVQGKLGPARFPLGSTLRAMAAAVPSLRDWAASADPAKRHAAIASLDMLAAMIEDGEHLDFVLGRDAALVMAFLPLRLAHAERSAVANLCARHAAEGREPPTEQEMEAVREPARKTAALRLELSSASRQLERLLATGRRPSAKAESATVTGDAVASAGPAEQGFMTAQRRRGGRDLALLVARISELEQRILPLEQNVRVLDPQRDGAAAPGQPWAAVGTRSTEAMAFDALDLQGPAGARGVMATNGTPPEIVAATIETCAAEPATPPQLPRDELFGGAPATDPDVVAHFRGQAAAARAMVRGDSGDASRWDRLRDSAALYRSADARIAMQVSILREADRRLDRAHQILANGNPAHQRTLDPNTSQGLQHAKAIVAALDADRALRRHGADAQLQARRDAALDKLRGLDTGRTHRPWQQKAAASLGLRVRPNISELAALRLRAEAIVLLHETAPREKAAARARIAQQGAIMEQILTQRRHEHPAVAQWARRTVQTAVVACLQEGAPNPAIADGTSEGFEPGRHRDSIETLLRRWGLETDRFAPELDEVLHGRIGPAELAAWRIQAVIPRLSPDPADPASDGVTSNPIGAAAEPLLRRRFRDGATSGASLPITDRLEGGGATEIGTSQTMIDQLIVDPSLQASTPMDGSQDTTGIETLNQGTHTGSAEIGVKIGANAAFFAQLYHADNAANGLPLRGGALERATATYSVASGGGPDANSSGDAANGYLSGTPVGAMTTFTKAWKHTIDADHHVSSAEIVHQIHVGSDAVSAISAVATEEVRQRLQDNPELGRNVGAMLFLIGKDDGLSITYGVKPAWLRHANALFDEAAALYRRGMRARAAAVTRRAQNIFDDAASYQPIRISLHATGSDPQPSIAPEMRYLRWSSDADGTTGQVVVEIDIPSGSEP